MSDFKPKCLPVLIGSLPLDDHREATKVIFDHTPQIPLWPQLPGYKREGMILQYIDGLPGVREEDGKVYINGEGEEFEAEQLGFYEEFLLASEGAKELDETRFVLPELAARGFYIEKEGHISIFASDVFSCDIK